MLIGGSGIGALLAETLALRNVSVVVLTKDRPKFEAASGECLFSILSIAPLCVVRA
jgi:glycine/D-amino acid oxidase-like deaminating enzyme